MIPHSFALGGQINEEINTRNWKIYREKLFQRKKNFFFFCFGSSNRSAERPSIEGPVPPPPPPARGSNEATPRGPAGVSFCVRPANKSLTPSVEAVAGVVVEEETEAEGEAEEEDDEDEEERGAEFDAISMSKIACSSAAGPPAASLEVAFFFGGGPFGGGGFVLPTTGGWYPVFVFVF